MNLVSRRTSSTAAFISSNSTHANSGSISSVGLPVATTNPSTPPPSLYQQCNILTDRLLCVPGFDQYLDPHFLFSESGIDPVRILWSTFRTGAPLCALFNALQPGEPLEVKTEDLSNLNSCKASVYHFLLACKKELAFRQEQLFTISELYQDDTNGFVKVIRTVSEVLYRIESRGLTILPRGPSRRCSNPNGPKGNREKVVLELLETERKYVTDLEILQNYMLRLRKSNIVSLDTIRNLFANLNTLVDFQRRFLIGIETNAQLPPKDQRFGALFIQMEENFSVYGPFCANYSTASELIVQETPNLMKLSHVLEPTYALPTLLITPVQRICKYPLLVKELIKYTEPTSYDYYDELLQGQEAIKRVTEKVNEEQRKEENLVIVSELEERVDDWKNHSIESFGALLLFDKMVMSTNDVERELHVYLFEKILLCCKESKKKSSGRFSAGAATQFGHMMRSALNSASSSPKKPGLQLKGRIFITSITGVIGNSKNGKNALKVFWRDVEMESFTLNCLNEEQLKLWKSTLSKLVEESNQEKESLNSTTSNRNQRSTKSAPNLDSNAVKLNLQQGMGPVPRRAVTAGPDTYRDTFVRKPRDDDAVSFINASDDVEEVEEDFVEVYQSWDSRSYNPRSGSYQIRGQSRMQAKSDASESYVMAKGNEGDLPDHGTPQPSTQPSYPYPPGMSHSPLQRRSNIPYRNNIVYPTRPPPAIPISPSTDRNRQGEETVNPSRHPNTSAHYVKGTTEGGYSKRPANGPPTGSLPAPPRKHNQRMNTNIILHDPRAGFPPNPPPSNPLPNYPSIGTRSSSSPNML